MYGTRKEITHELKRMFAADEPIALLVWTTESVKSLACSHGITELEATKVLAVIGQTPMNEYQSKGVSFSSVIDALRNVRNARRPVTVPADVLARLAIFAEMALETESNIAYDDKTDLSQDIVEGLEDLKRIEALLAA